MGSGLAGTHFRPAGIAFLARPFLPGLNPVSDSGRVYPLPPAPHSATSFCHRQPPP